MFNNLKKHFVAGAMLLTASLGTSVIASAQDDIRTFTLVNRSSWTIRKLYVSPTSYQNWGYDRLRSDVLKPDYKFTLELEPGYYDLKLVDQDGDSCVVSDVDFRYSDSVVLNNINLLACEFLNQ